MVFHKRSTTILFIVVFILILALSAGCSGQNNTANNAPAGQATAGAIPPVKSSGEVVAEGKVVPAQYAKISFSKGGVVAELPFKEGDSVKEGDLLARLEDSETLRSSVAQAEESVILAQQAVDDLNKNASIDAARTFATISSSYDSLREADRQLYYFALPSNMRHMDMFEAADKMRTRLEEARKAWDPYKYEDEPYGTATERTRIKKDVDNAESDYRTALLRISYASKTRTAQADLDKARKDYVNLEKGPDPEKMAAAQAKLMNAEAALVAAKAGLADLELRATSSGTIAKLDIKVGENASPGVPVVTIADLSTLIVETDNLTEIEVVKIEKGQSVSIVADALPDDTMEGVVDSIAEVFEEKRGDVTYTVKIALPKVPEKLRWGMTVVSTFKAK
jgi:multidrug resistance efflux pump